MNSRKTVTYIMIIVALRQEYFLLSFHIDFLFLFLRSSNNILISPTDRWLQPLLKNQAYSFLFTKGTGTTNIWSSMLYGNYFHSHIFPPELPVPSVSYSNTPTMLLRKASLPLVDAVLQNTEPTSLLFCPK
jgi:hypothetical protein